MANSVLAPSCTNVRAVFVSNPTGGTDFPGRAETKRTVVTPEESNLIVKNIREVIDNMILQKRRIMQCPRVDDLLKSSQTSNSRASSTFIE